MLVSASVSASTPLSVSVGILANAVSIGANTVNGPPVLRVSTRPAAPTADTSVVSSGLLLAAVPTGSSAMPSTLPSPSLGTAAQAAPVGPAAAIGSDAAGSVPIGSLGGAEAAATPAEASDRAAMPSTTEPR